MRNVLMERSVVESTRDEPAGKEVMRYRTIDNGQPLDLNWVILWRRQVKI